MAKNPKCNSFSYFRQIWRADDDRFESFRTSAVPPPPSYPDVRAPAKSSLDDNLTQMTNLSRIGPITQGLAT